MLAEPQRIGNRLSDRKREAGLSTIVAVSNSLHGLAKLQSRCICGANNDFQNTDLFVDYDA